MRKFKKLLTSAMMAMSLVVAGSLAFAESASPADATPEDAAEEREFDPSGTYHAALGIQTCSKLWINRQGYYCESLNQYYGTENNEKLWAGDPSGGGAFYEGTFTDIEIKGNGTYTVKLEGADFAGETAISQLYVTTDIPVDDAVVVTDFTVNINGRDIVTFDEAELEDEDTYTEGGIGILAINHWRGPLVERLNNLGLPEDDGNGINLLTGNGNENISLTFTISGFDYDAEVVEEPEATVEENTEQAADDTQAATESTKDDDKDDSKFPVVPVVIIAVVVVIVVIALVVGKKKK